jgi:transaldolase/glucose-6-phosphate isomerase
MSHQVPLMSLNLGEHQTAVDARLRSWRSEEIGRRVWDRDHTVWSSEPLPELTNRLGWLDLPGSMQPRLPEFEAMARSVIEDGYTHIVLLGMGGSSLAPEVFASVFGSAEGYPALTILDSTHPTAVRIVERQIDPARTLFVVSSKSGTTLETMSLFRTMWHRVSSAVEQPGRGFVAITDAGSSLQDLAEERQFRQVINAPSEVGGRYSALSPFGLVPAALIGANVTRLLTRSKVMAEASSAAVAEAENPGFVLGAVLGELALAGVDKVTIVTSPALAAFPAWIEQLVAESTGKNGKGSVPVGSEPQLPPECYGKDRLFISLELTGDEPSAGAIDLMAMARAGHPVVSIELAEKADLGQEMFRWEMATAAAGAILGINPFDQPDVQLAKELAKRAMAEPDFGSEAAGGGSIDITSRDGLERELEDWVKVRAGDYIAIQAYLAPTPDSEVLLQQIRQALGIRLGVATTLGFGPRFLHSTGQLHKGGPPTGRFLQLVDEPGEDVAIPETDYSFGTLVEAQAQGDYQALLQRGRHVLRINLGDEVSSGLQRLLEMSG